MLLYWWFEVGHVARRILYREQIRELETFHDTVFAIQRFRSTLETIEPPRAIPF